MRRAVSFVIASVFASLTALAGCEVSPDGGTCQNTYDCDRSGSATTRECVRFNRRELPCGTNTDCVCCPRDPAAADLVPGCRAGSTSDAGGTGPEAGPEAGPGPEAGTCAMTCAAGTFCDPMTLACAPKKNAGQLCGGATECATGYCAQGVCCLTACTGAGVSCNLDEAFRGQCMRVTDAGGPAMPDASVDARADATTDAASDAVEAATDASVDASDAAPDAPADASLDAANDG